MMQRSKIGIGLMGLGVVGQGVASAIMAKDEYLASRIGLPIDLRRILVRDKNKALRLNIEGRLLTTNADDLLLDDEIDIVVEVMGGENPALRYIEQALVSGRYVVTANKEAIAKHGWELVRLARQNGVDILYEASVGGGIPIISPLRRDLLANEIYNIRAIINGTTNYVLTQMGQHGLDFMDAISQAQALGYAESDPANDVQGTDAAYKLAILASLAFQFRLAPEMIHREGIERIKARDFRYAGELGYTIKLLALARKDGASIQARVHPALVPVNEPLAKVDGVLNAIQVEGDLIGRVMFQGPGAGSLPTTSAILADVVDAAQRVARRAPGVLPEYGEPALDVQPMSEIFTRYYLRMEVDDRPGVLAQIANILGENQISIASVIQKETNETAKTAEIVIMTHAAREGAMQRALDQAQAFGGVKEIGNFIRVED